MLMVAATAAAAAVNADKAASGLTSLMESPSLLLLCADAKAIKLPWDPGPVGLACRSFLVLAW
jgi:hypothetical protein